MALLLDRRGDQIQITEDVVKDAAGNSIQGKEVMALLLDRRDDQIQVTERVAEAAARNTGYGKEVMALLLDRRGDQIQITKHVVKAAARICKWKEWWHCCWIDEMIRSRSLSVWSRLQQAIRVWERSDGTATKSTR